MVYWCGWAQCFGHMPAVVRCIFYLIGKLHMHPVGFEPTIIPSSTYSYEGRECHFNQNLLAFFSFIYGLITHKALYLDPIFGGIFFFFFLNFYSDPFWAVSERVPCRKFKRWIFWTLIKSKNLKFTDFFFPFSLMLTSWHFELNPDLTQPGLSQFCFHCILVSYTHWVLNLQPCPPFLW